jgi:hypothetical protein
LAASGVGGTLVEEAGGGDVPHAKITVAARQKPGDIDSGEA